jgi:hypothetical protein
VEAIFDRPKEEYTRDLIAAAFLQEPKAEPGSAERIARN